MKTFKQFREDAEWATTNMWLESKGFKNEVDRRRKKKKSYVDDRSQKIQLLKKRSGGDGNKILWPGLE